MSFTRVKSIKFKTLVCRFIIFTYRAGKFNIPAGSDEKLYRKNSEKLVGPIIHCSPDLTRV